MARLWLGLQGGCSNAAQSSVAIDVALGTTSEETAAQQLFHLRHFALETAKISAGVELKIPCFHETVAPPCDLFTPQQQ